MLRYFLGLDMRLKIKLYNINRKQEEFETSIEFAARIRPGITGKL